jgi:hypothetical protein
MSMSWPGLLILLAGLYLLVIIVRGVIDFARWFAENYLGGFQERRSQIGKEAEKHHEPKPVRGPTQSHHAAKPIMANPRDE